jgi:hypothetical protein
MRALANPFYVVTTNRVGNVKMSVNASVVLSRHSNNQARGAKDDKQLPEMRKARTRLRYQTQLLNTTL